MGADHRISRRRALQLGAAAPAVFLAACAEPMPSEPPPASGTLAPAATPTAPSTPSPTPTPLPETPPSRPVLFRDAALADGRSPNLQRGVSILVEGGRVAWIRPVDGEEDGGRAEVVDAAGATIVPGMVDGHAHVTGPGGAHWIDRFGDPPARLLDYAEANGRLAWLAGVRWLRDAGSPVVTDPRDGRERALAIGIRERWRDRRGFPAIRAAGTWLTASGVLVGRGVQAPNDDELVAAAIGQLDDGADLVKLYLEGPEAGVSPWSAAEVRRVVEAVHARSARVTAHCSHLAGARVAAEAGVDAIEHGFELDAAVAGLMAQRGIMLVSTLTVFRSWITFGATSRVPDFAGRQAFWQARLEAAEASVRAAQDAGVAIATGTDFGGGSSRANHLAWEVESLVAAGFEPFQALGAATWRGGELLGIPRAGVIREGGPADFFLVHGDPLSDPAALWRVWRHA